MSEKPISPLRRRMIEDMKAHSRQSRQPSPSLDATADPTPGPAPYRE